MFETAFPGTQTFLPLFTNAAAQPLSRFHQHSAIYNEAGRARIQSTFSGVCLVFIWCLLLFGNTLSRSDLSTENGLNTGVIITCSQRQKHIKPFGRHSKTACREFESYCPCQTQKSEKRLKQAISRTFLFDISSKKSHGARSENTVLTLKKSSKCSSGGNKSTVSVGYIIKISAVFGWLITKLFADFKKISPQHLRMALRSFAFSLFSVADFDSFIKILISQYIILSILR